VVDFLNVSIDKGFISIEKTAATHPHINVIDANSSTASDLTPHFSAALTTLARYRSQLSKPETTGYAAAQFVMYDFWRHG
jgi:hypothetical protein